jgi:myo-inositol 2-dehydrogenase/D-chiro-inositol 1-dehydrogenase
MPKVVGFTLFGAGRIGAMHAANLAANPDAALLYVYDVDAAAAARTATRHGAKVAPDVAAALADPAVEAVLIASSTATHVDLITLAAQAGKAVLCEKPIDLDIARVERCRAALAGCDVPIQIGFNRRYDASHRAVRDAVAGGAIGQLELLLITSRDPAPAPREMMQGSGGLFRDMTIHDFDMARFVLGADPVEVFATGSVMVDPMFAELDDIDTAMVVMRTASGALVHINNSRRAVYGYDQRIEAFGSTGMVQSDNLRPSTLSRYTDAATAAQEPLLHFFIERYRESYLRQVDDFIAAVRDRRPPAVTFEDGRKALLLADAAWDSARSGRAVAVRYD